MSESPERMPLALVLPVVHHLEDALAVEQAEVAFGAGADGVFLISHHGKDRAILRLAEGLARTHGRGKVGVNLLSCGFAEAFDAALEAGLGMVWADAPGIHGARAEGVAERIALDVTMRGAAAPRVFASVAFKYQRHEPDPAGAALRASDMGMLPTTSGPATGSAPDVAKLAAMRAALGERPLAVASGMTPENVGDFLPYVSHFLVATGVSVDEHRLDPARLAAFVAAVRAAPARFAPGPDRG